MMTMIISTIKKIMMGKPPGVDHALAPSNQEAAATAAGSYLCSMGSAAVPSADTLLMPLRDCHAVLLQHDQCVIWRKVRRD